MTKVQRLIHESTSITILRLIRGTAKIRYPHINLKKTLGSIRYRLKYLRRGGAIS